MAYADRSEEEKGRGEGGMRREQLTFTQLWGPGWPKDRRRALTKKNLSREILTKYST